LGETYVKQCLHVSVIFFDFAFFYSKTAHPSPFQLQHLNPDDAKKYLGISFSDRVIQGRITRSQGAAPSENEIPRYF